MTEDTPDADCTINSTVADLFDQPRLVTVRRPPCDGCEDQIHDGLTAVELGPDIYEVCEGCISYLANEIENYYWWDRLTKAHYDRAAEFLRSIDEVWCVKDHAHQAGEMWVHTPYCDAGVVTDVCNHYGFRIRWFSIRHPSEHGFECLHDHGPCIEINLDYNHHIKGPIPLEHDLLRDTTYYDADDIDEANRLFDN